jgi:curved DNA-binding protein CbpA
MLTHYEVLNVPSDATASEIKKAFRRESITWHPDKHAGDPDAQTRATLKFKQLNEANQHLSDQAKRFAYDRKLRYGMGSDEYEMSYGMFGRQEDKLWREELLARQRELEGEMANSKAHREKVKQQEKARAEQDRIVEAERMRRKKAEEDAAQKEAEALAEEDRMRKAHLESEMRRLQELSELQQQREKEIAEQRKVANDLAEQLRQLQEQQLFDSDEDGDGSTDGGIDGDEQDAAYRRAYEEYLRRRNEAGLHASDDSQSDDYGSESSDLEDDSSNEDVRTGAPADALTESDDDLDQTRLDETDGNTLQGAEFLSDDPYDSFRATPSGGCESDDVDSDSDGEVMAAAEQAMLRAEKAIHRRTAAAAETAPASPTPEEQPLPRVPPPPPPADVPTMPTDTDDASRTSVELPPQGSARSANAGSTWRGPRQDARQEATRVECKDSTAGDSDKPAQMRAGQSAREAWAESPAPVSSPAPRPPPPQPADAAATSAVPESPAGAASASPASASPSVEGKVPSPVFGDATGTANATTAAGTPGAHVGGNGWLKELRAQLKTEGTGTESTESPSSSEPSPTPATPV